MLPNAYLGITLAAALLFLEMWKDRRVTAAPQPGSELEPWRFVGLILAITVWTGLYYVAFERLGYIVATAIYLLALMAWFHRGKWVANVLTALLFSGLSYWMFVALDVRLPQGILPF